MRVLFLVVAGAAAAFHLWSAGVQPFTALVQRPVHLALMGALGFLGLGIRAGRDDDTPAESAEDEAGKGWGGRADPDAGAGAGPVARGERPLRRHLRTGWDALLTVALVAVCAYLVAENRELVARAGSPTPADLLAGGVAVLLVLELARRTTGWGLVVVAVAALGYALAGPRLPGLLAHRGYGPTRLAEHLYLTTEGIWGVPLGVSADFVYLFILFGAVLDVAGGGRLLIALADRVAGGTRGGPAKTAAVASALMGSLSGSAVANVVTTGSFTIPLMRRAGFRRSFAAAIEAAASTGGQLMPPVMGAGAFILATWTRIPYPRVALAALVPALLYYAALLLAIHFRAGRMGIEPASKDGRDREGDAGAGREPLASRLHLLVALGVIVLLLALGRSPMRAAFWGVVSAVAMVVARSATRPGAEGWERALLSAAAGTVQVAAACAAAGIVVGVASLTGIGLRMSELVISLSGGHLLPGLALTAVGSIVLGMGLPTTAAYVVLAALGAPALVEMGVPLLAAHLFIFYFGAISNVTPPVSLAAYAAAGISGASPLRTAVTAMGLASAGFLVPFAFVYGPTLLLVGSPWAVVLSLVTGLAGVTALAAAVVGWLRGPLGPVHRLLLGAAAVTLVFPGILTDGFGLLALAWVTLGSGGPPRRRARPAGAA